MRKHIAYLIAGLIAGLILGILVSAGGQEAEVKEEKKLEYFLNPELPIEEFISSMNDNLRDVMDELGVKMDEAKSPFEFSMIGDLHNMTMLLYAYIQNQKIILQNERIIELLEEIKDKE